MDKQTIRQKLDVKRIWDDAYYGGRCIISDATYDALKEEIRLALEADPMLNAEFSAEFTATSFSRLENTFGDIKHDFPMIDKDDYIKYRVFIQDHKYEIVFYKSKKSDRWWMEVPCPTNVRTKYERHYLIPCSYSDYQTALREEMPDRWWQVYQKLM